MLATWRCEPQDYWSVLIRTYLIELKEAELMAVQLQRRTSLANLYRLQVVQAGKVEIGARIARGIGYLGGMAGAW